MIYILGAGSVTLRIAKKIQEGFENTKIVSQHFLPESSTQQVMSYKDFRTSASEKDSIIIGWRSKNFNKNNEIVTSTLKYLETSAKYFSRVVYLSSGSVYGDGNEIFDELTQPDPKNDYAKEKLELEQWCVQTFKSDLAILRISNVFGDSKVNDFVNRVVHDWKFDQSLTIFDINHFSRDYICIEDVSKIVSNLISNESLQLNGLQYFNVSSNTTITNGEIISLLEGVSPKKNAIDSINVPRGIPLTYQLNNEKILSWIPAMSIDPRTDLENYFRDLLKNSTLESEVEFDE